MGPELVSLDRDHPGFRDAVYRERRNAIAGVAMGHRSGDPVPEITYRAEEQRVWAEVLRALAPLHQRHACGVLLARLPALGFCPTRVPQLSEVSETLGRLTGFSLEPVAGLVSPRCFMGKLGQGVFLATQYVRHHSRPLYTPEPDVIHELVGHAAQLALPEFAEINRLFGAATELADEAQLERLARVYWYSLEFGAVRENGAPRAVGAGLLSSFGELGRFQTEAMLRPFDVDEIARTPFDPTDYQQTIFVASGVPSMLERLRAFLEEMVAAGRRGAGACSAPPMAVGMCDTLPATVAGSLPRRPRLPRALRAFTATTAGVPGSTPEARPCMSRSRRSSSHAAHARSMENGPPSSTARFG
jgi:phenylalanine-4-hydroxylase